MKKNDVQASALAEHAAKLGHSVSFEKSEVLGAERHGRKRMHLEFWYIQTTKDNISRSLCTLPSRIVELATVFADNAVRLTRISGDKWRNLRALTSPAFKSSTLKRAFSIIDECADEFLEIMQQTAQKREGLDISKHFLRLNMDILSRFTMGVKLNAQGGINYDNIFKMLYLNQVIAESLRFYPPLPGLVHRRCEKDFEFNGFRIPKETNINVPVRLLHHDPRYWTDPEEFNPDRFSPENKAAIEPMAYIPFGIGPRSCIASRFAQMELALIIAKILTKFKLDICDQPEK
ncbi:hypothetical protein HPB47_026359, partial [Ixodes persulcatus]